MFSRLTLCATAFAVLTTASLTYAASAHTVVPVGPVVSSKSMRIVQLERVVIVAKRLPRPAL